MEIDGNVYGWKIMCLMEMNGNMVENMELLGQIFNELLLPWNI